MNMKITNSGIVNQALSINSRVCRILVVLFAMLSVGLGSSGQKAKTTTYSNSSMSFDSFVSGVKYVEIGLNAHNQELVDRGEGIAAFYELAKRYLTQLGFEYVAVTSAEKTDLEMSVKSYCELASVMFGGEIGKKSISNSTITFISCNGDFFSFQSDKTFNYSKFSDVEKKIVEDWKSILGSKSSYNPSNQLVLPSNPTDWTLTSAKTYLQKNPSKLHAVEGIYERVRLSFEDYSGGKYTVAIVKNPGTDEFLIIYLSGATNSSDWKSGELKGVMSKTSTPGFFSVNWITRDKSLYEDVYCNLDWTGVSIYSSGVVPLAHKFVRTLPVSEQ